MGKFRQAGSTGGGLSALQRLANEAQPDLPTGRPEEQVQERPQQPNIQPQTAQDPGVNLQRAEELPSPFQQPQDQQQRFEADLEEQQRHAVPDLRARWTKQTQPRPIMSATASSKIDGGIIDRANAMAESARDGIIVPPVSVRNTEGFELARAGVAGPDIANAIAEKKNGSIQAAVNRVGAVDYTDINKPVVDPDFMKAGSLVTENAIAQFAAGADIEAETTVDPIAEAFQENEDQVGFDGNEKIRRILKQQGNAQVGKQIATEYQRLKGNPTPDVNITPEEAESLGDAFKMMWVAQNPTLAHVASDQRTNQKYIELTPKGEDVLAKGQADRKRLFPSANVKPAKNPPPKGELRGDTGLNVVKTIQGGVNTKKKDIDPTIRSAMDNLARVPNVVDKQRMKILFSTALPVLQNMDFTGWQATINNIGKDKEAKYIAKHGRDVAQGEMIKAAQTLANEIQSIAQERNGANYLTYAMQGFQGRISPQQGKFNPTTSKAVRFVTRNAVPSPAKPGSRVDYNLRQMYTMMLVDGGDSVLPHIRETKFEAEAARLEAWGDRLQEAMQMTDADAEAIAQAIEAGTPVTDPNFPQVAPIALDPERDAELIKMIEKKGEDGPHFIDGVIDASKYLKARRAGKPYHSYFNAYIDGKTNGIASNGIQMGNSKTARQTGVLRYSTTDYLDQPGDVRAELKKTLLEQLDTNGFEGNVHNFSSELTEVARAVFSHRDLNKKTTMTFGYGKEIDTFGKDMYETAMELKQNPDLIDNEHGLRDAFMASIDTVEQSLPDSKEFGETLMMIYGDALESVMSKEALASRAVMRASAVLHAATNTLLTIEGPTKLPLSFGRNQQIAGEYTETPYFLRGEGIDKGKKEFIAVHQQQEPTSAAARTYTSPEGEQNVTPGDFAYGGSVVGPVQALDAATVAKTAAGPSWNRLKQASGNNPYLHTIYDAFKADAMGYDVVLEEVNQNWLNTSMDWSYLKETKKSTLGMMEKWRSDINQRIKDNPNEELTANESSYMNFILKKEVNSQGKPTMKNYINKIGVAGNWKAKKISPWKESELMAKNMASVDYDWQKPPLKPTVRQLKMFVDTLHGQLDIFNRLDKAITLTEKQKKELRKEIMQQGYKTKSGRTIALQYYAH